MKRSAALVLGLSIVVTVSVHCQEAIGPGHKSLDALNEELARLKVALMQSKQGSTQMKRQINHLTMAYSIANEKKVDVDKNKEQQSADKHSDNLKCILYTRETETKATKNFVITPEPLPFDMLSIRSEIARLSTSVNKTVNDVLLINSELTKIQTLLNGAMHDILSTRAELKSSAVVTNEADKNIQLMKSEITKALTKMLAEISSVNKSVCTMREELEAHLSASSLEGKIVREENLLEVVERRLKCLNPPKIEDSSTVTGTDSDGRVTATYSCNKGFINTGGSDLVSSCIDGVWTKADLKCTGCASSVNGRTVYSGRMYRTTSGLMCQSWSSQYPHKHDRGIDEKFQETSARGPETVLEVSNYCRDPDPNGYLWCYTISPDTRWERCADVPQC